MHGLGNKIIAHTRHLRAFYHARDRVALVTVTALYAAQEGVLVRPQCAVKNEFNPSLVTIVASQRFPHGKQRM